MFERLEERIVLSTDLVAISVGVGDAFSIGYVEASLDDDNIVIDSAAYEMGEGGAVEVAALDVDRFRYPSGSSFDVDFIEGSEPFAIESNAQFLTERGFPLGYSLGMDSFDAGFTTDDELDFTLLMNRPQEDPDLLELPQQWRYQRLFFQTDETPVRISHGTVTIAGPNFTFLATSGDTNYVSTSEVSESMGQGHYVLSSGEHVWFNADATVALFAELDSAGGFHLGFATPVDVDATLEDVAGTYHVGLVFGELPTDTFEETPLNFASTEIEFRADGTYTSSSLFDDDEPDAEGTWEVVASEIRMSEEIGDFTVTVSLNGRTLMPTTFTPSGVGLIQPLFGVGVDASGLGFEDVLTTYPDLSETLRPVVYELGGDAAWRLVDLMQETGIDEELSDILSYVDPKDGNTYVAASTTEAIHLFRRDAFGEWTTRNLVEEIDGAVPVATGLAHLTSLETIELADGSGGTIELDSFTPDGQEGVPTSYLLGIDEETRLRLYWQDGTVDEDGNYGWTHLDLSNDLFSNTQDAPVFTGRVETYVTSWGGLNFAGLDASGELWSIWYSPSLTWENNGNTNHWHASNLSDITGAPELEGAVSVYLTSWSGINIAGITPTGDLVVTWWVPSFGSEWVRTDFSAEFGGPSLVSESLSTYVTPWGGLNVVGVDASGDLNVYWWVPSEPETWNVSNLTSGFDEETARPSGPLTTIITPVGFNRDAQVINSETSIIGHDAESGDVIRAFWEPSFGGTWMLENVTDLAT